LSKVLLKLLLYTHTHTHTHTHTLCVVYLHYIYIHTVYRECPRRNVPDFGRMFLMIKYTDITQNIYIQSSTVTEIMTREMCGFLAVPSTVPVKPTRYPYIAHVRP